MSTEPLVGVVTPVYNGEDFLVECIESVLAQTHRNFEYLIINNRSTDRTLEIATSYAARDPRIRVFTNEAFVGVIANHNIAFAAISPAARYCKVVSADDYLYPECLAQLVGLAEANPRVGIVGCYLQKGNRIAYQGFPFPKPVMTGREVCRQIFLGGDPAFGFGAPTSLLYRADLVRDPGGFYPDPSPHSDTSACFKHLRDADFGFVYQVLCYARPHQKTQSARSKDLNRYSSAYLNDVLRYGRFYLDETEFHRKLRQVLNAYFEYLAANLFKSRGKEFWDYHRERLRELGYPISPGRMVAGGVRKVFREVLNPERAIGKLRTS